MSAKVVGTSIVMLLVACSGSASSAGGDVPGAPRLRILSQGTPVSSGDSLQLRAEMTIARDTLTIAVHLRSTTGRQIRIELGGCQVTPELFRNASLNGQPIAGWLRSGNVTACSHHLMLFPLAARDTVTPSDLSAQVAFADIVASTPPGRYVLVAAARLGPGSGAQFRLPAGEVQLER